MQTLYKQNNTGKIQQWQVEVEGNSVISTFGQLEGKLQTTTDVIKKGKNIGKVNETTPETQAQLKAQQLYEKKLKQGYTPDLELAKTQKNVLAGVEPMLAFPIEKKDKYVTFPAWVQPKLDGMRCIAVLKDGKCSLFTRTQKPITTLPHIVEELEEVFVKADGEKVDIVLDGELYNHEYKENFNKIISLIKRDEVHPESHQIQYHVYDVVGEGNWAQRTKLLKYTLGKTEYTRQLPTYVVESREDLENAFHACLEAGYEGAMYRNMDTEYEHKRSPGLLKVKVMQDAEFMIIGVLEGNGKLSGHAGSFVCQTKDGHEFKAKLKGELDNLKEYFVNINKYVGKALTVQFQGLTPDGVPRFPVGLHIRDYE